MAKIDIKEVMNQKKKTYKEKVEARMKTWFMHKVFGSILVQQIQIYKKSYALLTNAESLDFSLQNIK